jgi:pyruvate dehydrogenase E2 component (dihydrolipoamide acetyltransferase)
VVKELRVKSATRSSEGSVVLVLEAAGAAAAPAAPAEQKPAEKNPACPPSAGSGSACGARRSGATGPVEVRVPDIGDFKDVAVIEVLVKPGDTVKLEQA